MGKKKEKSVGGANRRRQTLQLESEPQTNFGNPLGGYLSHYMDSEEDDLDEQEPENETKANSSMTNEVEDFLKEIDAISSVATATTSEVIKTSTPTMESATVASHSSDEVVATESELSITDVPQCDWQECNDEGSGYTYYWNVHTNEVTWECPEEYRRYVDSLVASKQSVPPITNLAIPSSSSLSSSVRFDSEKIKSTSTNTKAGSAPMETSKNDRKPSIEEGKVVLITSYGWSSSNEENSSDDENELAKARVRSSVVPSDGNVTTSSSPSMVDDTNSVCYGPVETLEPASDGDLSYGPSLPPELLNAADADCVEVSPKPREVSSSSYLCNDNVLSVKSESNPSSPSSWVLTGQAIVSQSTDLEIEELQEEPDSTTVKPILQPSPPRLEYSLARFDGNTDETTPSSFCSSSVSTDVEIKCTLRNADRDRLKWDDNQQGYLQYNPDNTGNGRPCRPGFGFEGQEESSVDQNKAKKRKKFRMRGAAVSFVKSDTLDLNEVNHQNALEYEARSVESQPCDNIVDSFDDIDVIERELDIALEQKRNKEKHEGDSAISQMSDEDSSDKVTPVKLPDSSVSLEAEFGPMNETEDDIINQDSVGDASNVILEKLGHFGATTSELTELQILLVELKTRLKDWIDGALNTSYFVKELKVYKEKIIQLESASVPEGWTCEWDRSSKCYNYVNVTTRQMRRKTPKDNPDDDTTTKRLKREKTSDTVAERLLEIPAFASFNPTSTCDSLHLLNKSDVSYSYSTTFLSPDSCHPPLPTVLIESAPPPLPPPDTPPLPPPDTPPLPPPDTPPLPPPPPDSTEPHETSKDTTEQIPLQPEDCEDRNATSTPPAFPTYETISAPDTYPTSSALELELDSFYSNIAADEAIVASYSAPSVPVVTLLPEVSIPVGVDSRESDPSLESVPTVQRPFTSAVTTKKKIKKTKIASGLIMKKKNMPSLVEKWKRIKREQLEEIEMSPTGGNS